MPRRSNITIKDIAKKLGISFSTVAKALKNDPVVAEETRQKVQETAHEMGYFPNLMASALRSKSTRSIGVILNDLENQPGLTSLKRSRWKWLNMDSPHSSFDSAYDESIEQQNILNLLSRMPECILISPVNRNFANMRLLDNVYNRTIILSKENKSIPTNYVTWTTVKEAT